MNLMDIYGFSTLRKEQVKVIESIDDGHHTLGLIATGGGKSLCYQWPVIQSGGKALVITPLISLMEDQVANLKKHNIRAVCIHSQLDIREKQMIMNQLNHYQFIFCSPEWITTDRAIVFLKDIKFTHVVIDEAHCISEWGFDFRPHYLLLNELIERLYPVQVIALTATANEKVINDIKTQLNIELNVINQLSTRTNIYLRVESLDYGEKNQYLIEKLKKSGPTIIYFSSKVMCDEVNELLRIAGFKGKTYHGDMSYEDRMQVQINFTQDKIQYVCATSAFGMGIDKKNVRTVIHYHLPKSLFQYIQEVGRAGRDNKESEAILLYSTGDEQIGMFFIERSHTLQSEHSNEEQKVKWEIFQKKFKGQNIAEIIENEYALKVTMLNEMLNYIYKNECKTGLLNKTDVTYCGNCSYCESLKTFKFNDESEQSEIFSIENYITSLFS